MNTPCDCNAPSQSERTLKHITLSIFGSLTLPLAGAAVRKTSCQGHKATICHQNKTRCLKYVGLSIFLQVHAGTAITLISSSIQLLQQ